MAANIIVAQNVGADGETFSFNGVDYTVGVNAFATISKAVNQAKSSSEKVTIEICSGEYTENISFGGRTFVEDDKTYVGGITFKAAEGADVKVNGYFQCNGVAGDLKDIVFDGLTITNSTRNGGYFAPIMFGDNYSGKTASGIVIQNCTLNSSTGSMRFTDAKALLDYGFKNYSLQTLAATDESFGEIPVKYGKKETVAIYPKEELTLLSKKSEQISAEPKIELYSVKAPVKEGAICGKLMFEADGKIVKECDLIVREAVPKQSFWETVKEFLKVI